MFSKIKNFISKRNAKLSAFALALLGGVLAGSNVYAAVDADVASTTGSVVSTMKENVIGVITTNISDIVIVGVIIFSIGFVWRLARRFMK